ncbi:uncharacterized protein LOC119066029 [Bradysia coprophila]|uniref:uncharacterized protein LOC119066029 n=1 Tax=Bradysia coprophila TaxID=38358 RepID=UPI00187DD4D9|nr:uncharacterized protein LOC119066029 [Bradysia coprophila]
MTAPEPSLPENRVREAVPFEVTGVDLGGPLTLVNGKKAWFVVFTCAVYRAIHLELITSLSTIGFIQALRRFIARRGRPEVIYTDNGTNFTGTEGLMDKLDWEEIAAQSEARRIRWIFNPPSAPWWGGWWEKIVGMVKQLVRKSLDRALLDYEEMSTALCDFEQLINLRPLTYLSEDPKELIPITPMMFLNEAKSCDVIDLDKIESSSFGEKFKQRQVIREELRERFRKEYLSLLVHRNIRLSEYKEIKTGDVVIVEEENKKRVHWPVARVIETFPGQDKLIRSVKIRLIRNGKIVEIDRPIQRLYMLESSTDNVKDLVEDDGQIKKPMTKHMEGNEPSSSEGNEPSSLAEGNEPSSLAEGNEPSSSETKKQLTLGNSEPSSSSLELRQSNKTDMKVQEVKVTRSGRIVNKPNRFGC